MPTPPLRVCLLLASLGLLTACVLLPPADAQIPGKAPPPAGVEEGKDTVPFSQGLLLPADAGLGKKLQAVREYVEARSWDQAVRLLQDLLEMPQDVFIPLKQRGPEGTDGITWG